MHNAAAHDTVIYFQCFYQSVITERSFSVPLKFLRTGSCAITFARAFLRDDLCHITANTPQEVAAVIRKDWEAVRQSYSDKKKHQKQSRNKTKKQSFQSEPEDPEE